MSTRSIVAFTTESGILGRYVHSDGYPSARIPDLLALLRRDGVDVVTATMLAAQWSHLDPAGKFASDNHLGARGEYVPGYGLAYSAEDSDGKIPAPERWEDSYGPSSWLEYGYIVRASGKIEAYGFGDKAYRMTALRVLKELHAEDRPLWAEHVAEHYPKREADAVARYMDASEKKSAVAN